eukprot:TRINITY_DN27047_c0_g2_i1.p1 TRINITY_DN27047_c0_g2~~TRINITY_DN27047_c0_g2_i1.p1  ORF type:complete len:1031 (-),score=251.33 TRINITY_DN27047_c0_g2_i1:105-3197(-)
MGLVEGEERPGLLKPPPSPLQRLQSGSFGSEVPSDGFSSAEEDDVLDPNHKGHVWGRNAHYGGSEGMSKAPSIARVESMSRHGAKIEVEEDWGKLPIFKHCSHGMQEQLLQACSILHPQPGELLVKQHEECTSLFVVVGGMVEMTIDGVVAGVLMPVSSCNHAQLLGLETASQVTLTALEASTVCELAKACFDRIHRQHVQEHRRFGTIIDKNSIPDVLNAGTRVNPCAVFSGLSEKVLNYIDQNMMRQIYFPEETIIEDGKQRNLYVLMQGCVIISIAGRQVRMEYRDHSEKGTGRMMMAPTPCYGELGIVGLETATTPKITAKTVCHMRFMHKDLFRRALHADSEKHNMDAKVHEMVEFAKKHAKGLKSRITGAQRLGEAKMFKEVGCSDKFLKFLGECLEDRLFIKGQCIIAEGASDDRSMYILSQGHVSVVTNGVEVTRLSDGAIFGEITVLGLASRRSSTVNALQTCYTQVLHRNIVVRGLELFPAERHKVLMIGLKGGTRAQHSENGSQSPTEESAESLQNALVKVLSKSQLFATLDTSFLEAMSAICIERIYMPGDVIISEGSQGDSMFVVVSGNASVYVSQFDGTGMYGAPPGEAAFDPYEACKPIDEDAILQKQNKVGAVQTGSIVGELTMLGVLTTRSATIVAGSICSLWEIKQEHGFQLLQRFPDAAQRFKSIIVENRERTVPASILSLPVFSKFDRKLKMFLAMHSERLAMFPQNTIARENKVGRGMYIISLGMGVLTKKGETVKTLVAGSTYGATIMMGIHSSFFGTLVALRTCHVLLVTRSSFYGALEQYPCQNLVKQAKATELAAEEKLRDFMRSVSTRKLIWRRYREQLNKEEPTAELTRDAFDCWRKRVGQEKKRRRAKEKQLAECDKEIQKWRHKQFEARKLQRRKRSESATSGEDSDCSQDAAKAAGRSPRKRQGACGRGRAQDAAMTRLPGMSPTVLQTSVKDAMKDWPKPRASPFYKLKFLNVIHQTASTAGVASLVLPAIGGKNGSQSARKPAADNMPVIVTQRAIDL